MSSNMSFSPQETYTPSFRPCKQGLILIDDPIALHHRNEKLKRVLVGTFIDTRVNTFTEEFIQRKINSSWHTGYNVEVMKQKDLFFFFFDSNNEKDDVLRRSPCSIDGALLILRQLKPSEVSNDICFGPQEFWIQLHRVPLSYQDPLIAMNIAQHVGPVLMSDNNDYRLFTTREYLRFKIALNPYETLAAGVFIPSHNGPKWIQFKYEKIHKVCILCGKIGHSSSSCRASEVDIIAGIERKLTRTRQSPLQVCFFDPNAPLFTKDIIASTASSPRTTSLFTRYYEIPEDPPSPYDTDSDSSSDPFIQTPEPGLDNLNVNEPQTHHRNDLNHPMLRNPLFANFEALPPGFQPPGFHDPPSPTPPMCNHLIYLRRIN